MYHPSKAAATDPGSMSAVDLRHVFGRYVVPTRESVTFYEEQTKGDTAVSAKKKKPILLNVTNSSFNRSVYSQFAVTHQETLYASGDESKAILAKNRLTHGHLLYDMQRIELRNMRKYFKAALQTKAKLDYFRRHVRDMSKALCTLRMPYWLIVRHGEDRANLPAIEECRLSRRAPPQISNIAFTPRDRGHKRTRDGTEQTGQQSVDLYASEVAAVRCAWLAARDPRRRHSHHHICAERSDQQTA